MNSSYYIRDATEDDLPTIVEIYNEQIMNSSSLFMYSPVDLQNRLEWFMTTKSKGFPVLVAVKKGSNQDDQEDQTSKEEVAAYCSLGTFRDKPAYNASAEVSLYVHINHRRQGLGKILMNKIIEKADEINIHAIIASITVENSVSLNLYSNLGFRHIGTFKDTGYKFGRWLDVAFYELILPNGDRIHPKSEVQ
ncbi:putative phosphinothricin acetyltransferase protein [Umbelopsis sp. PMI_123]|nr:putative phosphinothricin acetyltransferase protein [Umbelopsis sp. PMI_123]